MRLWSLHPQYLDTSGILALWRESLLAKAVLMGKTKGYKNHPQLLRFREHPKKSKAINYYLQHIWIESKNRGFNFDESKFSECPTKPNLINVTSGQLQHELQHLKTKLTLRQPELVNSLPQISNLITHPLFIVIKGPVESWEKT